MLLRRRTGSSDCRVSGCRIRPAMQIELGRAGGRKDRFGAGHLGGGAVRHHQEAVGFNGGLVLHHAVLRMPMLVSAAPIALRPPTTMAPSTADKAAAAM